MPKSAQTTAQLDSSLVAQRLKPASAFVCLQCRGPQFDPWVRKIPWGRKWQPTPVFLPGKSHWQRSLVGYSPRGCKELDTTEQLHFHMLEKWYSKFSKPGFSNPWTENFQMFKLVLEKAEEPEIKLPISTGSLKKLFWVPEKHLLLLFDYTKAFDCVDHNKLWKILKEIGIADHLTCLLRNLYSRQEATV